MSQRAVDERCLPGVRALVGVLDGAEGGERVQPALNVRAAGAVDRAGDLFGGERDY